VDCEIRVRAVGKKLRAPRAEVCKSGNELLRCRGGRLREMDRGVARLLFELLSCVQYGRHVCSLSAGLLFQLPAALQNAIASAIRKRLIRNGVVARTRHRPISKMTNFQQERVSIGRLWTSTFLLFQSSCRVAGGMRDWWHSHRAEKERFMTQLEENITSSSSAATIDMKLEVVVIPVSDVDRAKEFYGRLGWRLDADFRFDNGFRVVQFTPPGSGTSVQFGTKVSPAAPGSAKSLFLVVSDIAAARDQFVARGADVSEVFHPGVPGAHFRSDGSSGRLSGPSPDHASYRSYATFSDPDGNSWLLQEVTKRLAGRIEPGGTVFASANDLHGRPSPRSVRPRRARKAHRTSRRAVACLVCGVHGGGTVWPGAAAMKSAHIDGSILATGQAARQGRSNAPSSACYAVEAFRFPKVGECLQTNLLPSRKDGTSGSCPKPLSACRSG
jgi:catechol 2,3-dioxygenase-like lactoylglutathione lyase family enzyme